MMDEDRRTNLIKSAIIDQLGLGAGIYTSEEVLIVAGISQKDIETLTRQLQESADALANQSKPFKLKE